MLKQFRETGGVLFGTTSFWEGVDVPGDALSLVVIFKLPFAPPTSPVPKERMNRIDRAGGNSFMDFSLPQAVIRLRQGFGRLIRTSQDSGRVVILDPRLLTKRYGHVFIDSLPKCEVIVDGDA
jgi:ATP-dependent DNA helicase DinG